MNIIDYKTALIAAKRAKYKTIREKYCYFVFQGYRIEALIDKESEIVCIVKGGSSRKTNNDRSFTDQIVFISDAKLNKAIIYNDKLFKRLMSMFSKFMHRHSKCYITR